MRDLAQQSIKIRKSALPQGSARLVRILVIVAIIVGAVLFINSGFNIPVVGTSGTTVRDALHNLQPVEVSEAPINVDKGVNLSSDKASFRNVSKISASATAERVYGGGSFTMTVTAKFVGTPGHKFQVWLTDGEKVADAGYLEGSGGEWATTFRDTDRGYSSLNEIWITDEITTEDNKPEQKILVGSF